jgi:hypothetical protein
MIRLVPACTEEDLSRGRALFEEYASSLHFDLDFQNFREELTGLPGGYAPRPKAACFWPWMKSESPAVLP